MEPVNKAELDWEKSERGESAFRRKKLAAATGAEELGCSLYELPAEKRAWPYHYHTGNEEAFYVLAGEGFVRTESGDRRLSPGDYLACPAGEAGAHRLVNDGDEPLRYLAVSTMNDPDVTVYPDSEKIGVFAGAPPGGTGERAVSGYFERDSDVDYWTGEE